MTFDAIVDRVAEDLNLTSTDALARIGRRVNERYRAVVTSLGLVTTDRVSTSVNTADGTPTITVTAEKVLTVRDTTSGWVLEERTLDEIRNLDPTGTMSGPPQLWAVSHQGGASVTLYLYPTPDDVRALSIDALETKSDLADTDVPDFPPSFHDVLIFGALADESRKIDKAQSEIYEAHYEKRLADLRYYLAKSAYLSYNPAHRIQPRWNPRIIP